jgi:hypothetical protein
VHGSSADPVKITLAGQVIVVTDDALSIVNPPSSLLPL